MLRRTSPWAAINANKYKNKKVDFHGYSFDSKLEAAVYNYLKIFEAAGEIMDLRVKPNVRLLEGTPAETLMIPDFCAMDVKLGEVAYFEAKGMETDVWLQKKKLWKVFGPGRLRIYKGSYENPKLVEEIIPKPYYVRIGGNL